MSDSLTRQALILMVGRGLGFLAGLLTPLLLVRVFNQHEYGEYRELILVITTFGSLISLGMEKSLFYYFPNNPEEKAVYLSQTVICQMMTGAVFIATAWYLRDEMADYFNSANYLGYALPLGVATAMSTFSTVVETVLIVERKTAAAAVIMVLTKIGHFVFIVCGALIGGVRYALLGMIFYLTIKCGVSLWYFRRYFKISLLRVVAAKLEQQLRYALPLGFGGVVGIITLSADKFAVSHWLGTESFAVYSVGCYELPFVFILFQSIGDILLPKLVEMKRRDNLSEVIRVWHLGIEKSAIFGIPMFVFCFYFAGEIITTLFTSKYASAVPIFRIMLFIILLESTRYGVITRAFARTGLVFLITLASLVIMVALLYPSIKLFGMMGAISTTVGVHAWIVVSELLLSKYILGLSLRRLLPVKALGTIALCGAIALVPAALLDLQLGRISQWIALPIEFLTYCCAFGGASYVFGLWKLDELLAVVPVPLFAKMIIQKVKVLFA